MQTPSCTSRRTLLSVSPAVCLENIKDLALQRGSEPAFLPKGFLRVEVKVVFSVWWLDLQGNLTPVMAIWLISCILKTSCAVVCVTPKVKEQLVWKFSSLEGTVVLKQAGVRAGWPLLSSVWPLPAPPPALWFFFYEMLESSLLSMCMAHAKTYFCDLLRRHFNELR